MTGTRRRIGVVPSAELVENESSSYAAALSGGAVAPQMRLIESTKATDRARGVQELADILREDARSKETLAPSIRSSEWELVLSWTAGILIKESQSFANKHSEEWPHMSATADRLRNKIQTQYSGYIRHIWIAAMPHLSTKLARFLIKHITDSLVSDPCVAYVFGLDYAKVLRAWAVHEQHVYNCKDGRAKAVVDLCISTLSRFNGIPESQNSTDSLPSQPIQPGDTELATTLHALVAAATPARLAGMSKTVMEFCADYCHFHIRENACMPMVLETANIVLLALADMQLSKNPERLKSMLSSSLQLWSTRTAILKRVVLYNIRILTRLVTLLVTESGDPEARALLELAQKTMMSGAWDKHKFMTLPRDLLSIWPLLHTPSKGRSLIVPLHLFAPLHTVISPNQAAFFDTVAFLAVYLTRLSSGAKDDSKKHRRKRARTAPTSLSRLLTEMGSGDSPDKSRGAAQLIWYISAVYSEQLGDDRCTELLQDVLSMIQSSDLSQRGDLAEWMLGILRLLSPWDVIDIPHSSSILSEDIWQHATAGVEAGLAGAAGLVFDVLHKQQKPSHEVHRQCRQAADALVARPGAYDADSARLLLFLSQYVRSAKGTATDESLAQTLSKSIMQLCEDAAKQRWPLALFSAVIPQVLGLSDPALSISDQISNDLVLDPDWNTELRFTQVLHTLALHIDSTDACCQLLQHHLHSQRYSDSSEGRMHSMDAATVVSNVFPAQWRLICERLLRFVEQVTSFEVGQLLGIAVPYIAHTIWRISGHLSAVLDELDDVERSNMADIATRITDEFSERFLAFVVEAKTPELVWQTMVFISPWTDGYTRMAALEGPTDTLLDAMFRPGDPRLLCDMAMGDSGSRLAADSAGNPNSSSSKESQIAATASRLSIGHNAEDRIVVEHRRLLEARMLSTAADVVRAPYGGIVDVLSALAANRSNLSSAIMSRIGGVVDQIDGPQLLIASELLLRCALVDRSLELVGQVLGKLKKRMLAFLDNESYTGHMPTLFAVLRVMQELIFASKDVSSLAGDEDLPRFVAWLDVDCRQGRIDACIEIEFVRTLVGPWSLHENDAYAGTLSVLEKSPTDMLLSRAQTARSPVTRVVAEEQLARHELTLSFVRENGEVVYPNAPEADVAEDLVLMTRDFGLALLICNSGSMIPGALSILLKQIAAQSGCPQRVVRLCHRLLDSIACIAGFPSAGQAIGSCASDIFSIDPELVDTIREMVESHAAAETVLLMRTHAAVEWMLRREFSRSIQILPDADDVDKGEWVYWLLAQLMAMSVYDSALYAQVTTEVLEPHFASSQLSQIVREQAVKIILQLLMLHRPERYQGDEIGQILAAVQASKPDVAFAISKAYEKEYRQQTTLHQRVVPRWGRRHGSQLVHKVIARIADENKAELHIELLTEPHVVWLVLHLESQLQTAWCNDRREQVAWALCQLTAIVSREAMEGPLLQTVLRGMLADNWQRGYARTGPQFFLVLGVVLDIASAEEPIKQIGEIAAGFANRLAKAQGEMGTLAIRECVSIFVALLTAVSATQSGQLPNDPDKLFVGSSLEGLYNWGQLSAVVLTRDAVHHSEDRLALAQIAKRAAQSLGDASRAPTSAEMLAAAVERVMHLALVEDDCGEDLLDAGAMDDNEADVDLASNVVTALVQVRQAAVQHMRGTGDGVGMQERTLLLRAVSLLETVVEDATRDATYDAEQQTQGTNLVWHIGRVIALSHSLQARAAAVDAARAAASAETEWLDAEWLDARQRRLLRCAATVPTVALDSSERPGWLVAGRAPPLDGVFLGVVCATGRTAESAVSELVCGLACGAGPRFQAGLLLLWEDAQSAVQMLPRVVHGALEQATEEGRAEIAAMLLDFAYNWKRRAAWMARAVVGQMLAVRQTDAAFGDVRAFFERLPLGLFELADLAAELEMGDTAAFLLECDLTCTGAGRTVDVAGITGDARTLLRRVYAGLGNSAAAQLLDSVDTVGDVMRRCRDAGDWRTLLLYQEAAGGRTGPTANEAGLAPEGFSTGDTLIRLGLLNSVPAAAGDASAAAYAAAWRLGRWDLPALPQASEGRLLARLGDAEEALYGVLRRRAGGQVVAAAAAAQALLSNARAVEAVTLPARAASDRWAFRAVAALLPLAAGDIGGALRRTAFLQASSTAAAVLAWSRGTVDPAALGSMHQANVALHEAHLGRGRRQYTAAVRAACVAARRADEWQAAMGLVFRLRAATDGDAVLGAALRLWEAETLWEAGSERLAAEMLRGLLTTLEHVTPTDATAVLHSRVVLTAGEWAERLRSERAEVLWDAYFGRAARLLEDVDATTAWTGRALHALAGFAARQCDELTAARDDEAAAALRRHKARELAACQRAAGGSRDVTRLRALQRRLEAQVAGDRREREALRASIDGFLRLALWALTQSLCASDAFNDDVYTLVALVATHERAPEMQRILPAGLAPNVSSHKFLPLARQLCGRLGGEGMVAAGVAALVRRMTIDYPFHVVPLLLALRNASARRGAPDGGVLERQRSSAAARLVNDAAATGSGLRSVVGTIDSLCSAYVELAAAPVPERMRGPRAEGRVVPFGARLRITQLFRAPPSMLPVLTAAPRTGEPRDYACVPFVMSAAPGYTLAGGVNLPKITRLLGDDGRRHKQLVKGRDDLRQDAVIQQLFSLFNRCMRGPVRAARPLRLRTYQVVPLTPRAGLLQWVDDTVPLGTWFRAHEAAYRPHAPSSAQLRATVHAVHRDPDADASRRRAVFDRVCQQAPPIFRFFFFENFASPPCWYARRDAYIRSAAAASIAGWVLGIGDRHLQNILVDHRSAELVHIDLGIAFDLGRLLPIPELVPFRLTRELVDGMGLLGLDATFRHACHAALHAMRDNARVVSTILNVLKVDPLYMWSLIPQRLDKINRSASMAAVTDSDADAADAAADIHELDGDNSNPDNPTATVVTEENQEAARSIMHIAQRLSATISVEGQVSELIQQATDPNLLSRMFEGWSAWC